MYFSIGAHEGYMCPEGIEEYVLKFDEKELLTHNVLNGNLLTNEVVVADVDEIFVVDEPEVAVVFVVVTEADVFFSVSETDAAVVCVVVIFPVVTVVEVVTASVSETVTLHVSV